MVHAELDCPCAGSSRVCSTLQNYSVSLVDLATGAQVWGAEQLTEVLHNDCSFTTVLGTKVPIPDAVAGRDPAELGLKIGTSSCAQIVPHYVPLRGRAGLAGPAGPAGPARPHQPFCPWAAPAIQ